MDATMVRTADERIIDAAIALFGERGVDGTSLQMIADALGVTKGAVYYHFKTKDEILGAVTTEALSELDPLLAEAEALESAGSHGAALEMLVPRLVALAVERRAIYSKLQLDPAFLRHLEDNPWFGDLMDRLDRLLSGAEPTPAESVRAAVIWSALAGTAMNHRLAALGDDELTRYLTDILEELLAPIIRTQEARR